MKVLILGAGASKCAGYPLASELMSHLKAWSTTNQNIMVRTDWETWDEFRSGAAGLFRLFLDDPNPEIALSALDLCDLSLASGPEAFKPEFREEAVGLSLSQDSVLPEQYFVSEDYRQAHRTVYARNALLRCLQSFFVDKHIDDCGSAGRDRRKYLRDLLATLRKGDAVITLNWDTTVETTLAEEGRWSPSDGYGFRKRLRTLYDGKALRLPLSRIVVLKLHGSIGWHRSNRHGLYFAGPEFLSLFEFTKKSGSKVTAVDPLEPQTGYPDPALLVHPSFMKDLGASEVRKIWNQAQIALRRATCVDVWGYSLPESDHAVRSLLENLRNRVERSKVSATVHDPSIETRARWKTFLPEINTDESRLSCGSPP